MAVTSRATAETWLELHTVSTHNTGLHSATKLTVLPQSGKLVVWGQKIADAPWTLHLFRLEERKLDWLRQWKWPCEHHYNYSQDIEGVTVDGKEKITAACQMCFNTKLIDLDTGDTGIAYSARNACHGEAGKMWAWDPSRLPKRDHRVRELNCSQKPFTETGRRLDLNKIGNFSYMCYMPTPTQALVLSCHYKLEAVSCETGQQLWTLEGEVNGKKLYPYGVSFHPEHQVLLVAEEYNNRILVLDPGTGCLLLSFPVYRPHAFAWARNELLLLHGPNRRKISHVRLINRGE